MATTRCHSAGGLQVNKFEQVSSVGHQLDVTLGGPEVNKFEQFLSEDHKMLLAGGRSTVRSNASRVIFTWGPPVNRQTQVKNITFPQLRWWAVITDALDE